MSRVLLLASLDESLVTFRGPLIRALRDSGHEVIAVAPAIGTACQAALRKLGAEPVSLQFSRTGTNPFADLAALAALVRLFRRRRPDVVFAYTLKPVIYGSLAARIARVARCYCMMTGLGNVLSPTAPRRSLLARLVAAMARLALARCDGVLFQNPDDRRFFETRRLLRPGQRSVVVDGSGVDLDFYAPAPLAKQPVFLLMGRFLAEKGLREYAAAARALRQRYPQAVFRLAGWIDDNPSSISSGELARWVADGDVEYCGRLHDVRPAIAACRVYVLPSYYPEGVPRSCLEAMAMGRPVITADSPGCRETVRDGVTGILVPPRSTEKLMEAMERFIREPELAVSMGRASLGLARARFDVTRVNQAILDFAGLVPARA